MSQNWHTFSKFTLKNEHTLKISMLMFLKSPIFKSALITGTFFYGKYNIALKMTVREMFKSDLMQVYTFLNVDLRFAVSDPKKPTLKFNKIC